jgi:quinol monooxygenase YgiN
MIVEYIRYQAAPDRGRAIVEAYRAALPHLRAAPECLSQEVAVCTEDEGAVTVRLLWTSAEAHMQGFRRGPHFPPFLGLVRPFIPDIAEMRHYAPQALD